MCKFVSFGGFCVWIISWRNRWRRVDRTQAAARGPVQVLLAVFACGSIIVVRIDNNP